MAFELMDYLLPHFIFFVGLLDITLFIFISV